jgi:hypothetical protein
VLPSITAVRDTTAEVHNIGETSKCTVMEVIETFKPTIEIPVKSNQEQRNHLCDSLEDVGLSINEPMRENAILADIAFRRLLSSKKSLHAKT